MHINLRIIHDEGSEGYSASEEQRVRKCISSAPGVTAVTDIVRHVRGGYSVTVDASNDSIEEMLAHISVAGYTPVL